MTRDLINLNVRSSFLSCEKDFETIMKKLFVESKPHDDTLKRLLVIPNKDCLDNTDNKAYQAKLKEMTVAKLADEGYFNIVPRLNFPEHEEIKNYIICSFDNFSPTGNPEFRDCTVNFDIICNTNCWNIGNFRIRPLKIAGYIDGILNNAKLSGLGTLQFVSCNELILDANLAGYTLTYRAVHGAEDIEAKLPDGQIFNNKPRA